jgi:hypothetical protein
MVLLGLTLFDLFPFSPHLALIPGRSSRKRREWWTWAVPCLKCLKQVTFESGIICANYGSTKDIFLVCNGAWCASCVTIHPLDQFEVKMPRDFNGASLTEPEDKICFKKACPDNHLCVPFQCPKCWSQNICGKSIDPTYVDDLVLEHMIIRATLDAFWSRATKTISTMFERIKI